MLKACRKCKQTNFGTGYGLEQVNGLNDPDARWSNIDRNDQTGDLTIKNIRSDQCKVYKVEINSSSMILHRKFSFKISGE